MGRYIRRLNFATLLGALVLLLLPWTSIQCNGREVATQSGVEAIYGGVSLSDDLEAVAKKQTQAKPDSEMGGAYFIAGAAVLVLAGVLVAVAALSSGRGTRVDSGLIAAAALALILIQAALGFPVNSAIAEGNKEAASKDPEMAVLVAGAVNVRADRTTWFYLELALLAIPAGYSISKRLPGDARADARETLAQSK